MNKYLIHKISKIYFTTVTREVSFDETRFELIETEKELNPDFHINKWNGTDWIEALTPEEINDINLETIKENVRQFLAKKKLDGKKYFNEFELIITMELAGMLIVDLVDVTNEIDTILYKPLNLIKNGDFFSAMMIFNNPNTVTPTIPLVLNHWNNIKAFTQNYFTENYPQEPIV